MATSRGATPADPVLAATTEDNSRGGLFNRSNTGNPVSGINVVTESPNNATISITLNYADGTDETRSFTTDQATNGDLQFTIPGTTNQGGGGGDEIHVTGGTVSMDGTMLTLHLNNGSDATPIDLTRLASQSELDTVSMSIPENFFQLNDTPTEAELDAGNGMVLGVNADGNIILTAAPPATVNMNSFSSTDMSIEITENGAQVNLEAQPTWNQPVWTNGGNRGSITGSAQVSEIRLGQNTGFVIKEVTGSPGVYLIDTPDAAPVQAGAPTVPEIPRTSALTASPAVTETITANGGTFANTGDVTATLTAPDEMTRITIPAPMFTPGDTTADIMIPMGATNEVGDYTLSVTTTTTPTDMTQMPSTDTVTRMIDRFYPVLQSRAEITAANAMSAIVMPPAEFTGTITATTGSGVLYFAVPETVTALTSSTVSADTNRGYPVRIGFVGTISITLPGSGSITYNQFRAPVPAGVELISFT